MNCIRIVFLLIAFMALSVFANETTQTEKPPQEDLPKLGSWIFSGVATNENGERLGYFFQMHRQGKDFQVKTALIDGQTNKLLFFYEDKALIDTVSSVNWQVGHAFIRHNLINDSWIFGVKLEDNQGFNFKVDMLKKEQDNGNTELKSGVVLQAMETTRLNGHIQTSKLNKEQFVTANKAWFAKIRLTKAQKKESAILTTFCRLNNDNGFYAAAFKGAISKQATLTGWRDAAGANLKMSKKISIKSLANDECLLHIGLPKLDLKLANSLKNEAQSKPALAGFSKRIPMGFCFLDEQSFLPTS